MYTDLNCSFNLDHSKEDKIHVTHLFMEIWHSNHGNSQEVKHITGQSLVNYDLILLTNPVHA